MRHFKTISQNKPALAQFESLTQLVGLITSLLALLNNISSSFFGGTLDEKNNSA